jgi:hypothetical protein
MQSRYFAKVEAGYVLEVIVARPDFLENNPNKWVETWIDGDQRKNYAGIGYSYDSTLDAFVPPKCHNEAVLDETTAQWNCTHEEHTIREIN